MALWVRYGQGSETGFGTLSGETISVHEGDLFNGPRVTGQTVALSAVKLLTPVQPTKIVGLWNNFRALAAKQGLPQPPEPLWFIKAATSSLEPGGTIRRPKSYGGKIVFEGELGVVIGKTVRAVSEADAPSTIFGYTCCNDITAVEILKKDSTFDQWTRCKSFDTFGPFGPAVATGLDPAKLAIKTILNGEERQNIPVSDMWFSPAKLVHMISQDLTLLPGDIVSCGTSVGVGSMKPGSTVEVRIEGIGSLRNTLEG
jgi:2-keto-4-pentenoate hydratase/2-oxohepta-3-ene-1,7-dioic acid hydratase in catechol pathway